MDALTAGVDALASFRITRLVVSDVLTADMRDAFIRAAYVSAGRAEEMEAQYLTGNGAPGEWAEVVARDPDPPKLATLVTCPHCAGMWVAFGVALARWLAPRPWAAIARPLALAGAVSIIASATE